MAAVGFCFMLAMLVLHKHKSTAPVVVELGPGLDP
jgi:hypothetical protein